MAVTSTKGERRQTADATDGADAARSAHAPSSWATAGDEEAQTRSDLRLVPDDEERLRWTTRTLVELEGDGDRPDHESVLESPPPL
jgi:hypothetical protein